MNDKFFSVSYKGFLIQQTDRGWDVPMLPVRSSTMLISQPPYSTRWIAQQVIDKMLESNERG